MSRYRLSTLPQYQRICRSSPCAATSSFPPSSSIIHRPLIRQQSSSTPLCQALHWKNESLPGQSVQDDDFSDISIVGGGVVGLALASSLASDPSFQSSGATLTVVEGSSLDKAREWANSKQDGSQGPIDDWENRAIYLTEENRQWLDKIGVTPYLVSSRLGPVHSMLVTDGVSGATLNFDVPNPTLNRMGTMVEISNLQQAMLRHIEALQLSRVVKVHIIDSSKVESIEADGEAEVEEGVHVDSWPVLRHTGSQTSLKSRLLVGADGSNSPVRKYAGIKATGWGYDRMGLVATMRTNGEDAEERTAYQRFLPTGTIAWLPVSTNLCHEWWAQVCAEVY